MGVFKETLKSYNSISLVEENVADYVTGVTTIAESIILLRS